MALMPDAAPMTEPALVNEQDAKQLRLFVMGLFFIFGGITSLNDVLEPILWSVFPGQGW